MPLFRKSKEEPTEPAPVPCPICSASLPYGTDRLTHWATHVEVIGPGRSGEGQFTWFCECGHCRMKWPSLDAAVEAFQYHMQRAHGISLPVTWNHFSAWDRDVRYSYFKQRFS